MNLRKSVPTFLVNLAVCLLVLAGVGPMVFDNLWQLASAKAIMSHGRTGCIAPEGVRAWFGDKFTLRNRVAEGLAYLCQGRLSEACGTLNLASPDSSTYGLVSLRLGLCREAQGDLDGAVKAWRRIYSSEQISLHLILKSQQPGLDVTRSEAYLRAAVAASPQYCRAHDAFAIFYMKQSRWDQAGQVIDSALSSIEKTDDVFCVNLMQRKGSVLVRQQQWAAAVPFLEAVLERNPQDRDTRDALGFVRVELGQYREARQVLQEQMRRGQESYYTYLNLGRSLQGLGEGQGAEAAYREAIKLGQNLDQDGAEAHSRLGLFLCSIGRQKDGSAELRIAYEKTGYSWLRDELAHCQSVDSK